MHNKYYVHNILTYKVILKILYIFKSHPVSPVSPLTFKTSRVDTSLPKLLFDPYVLIPDGAHKL